MQESFFIRTFISFLFILTYYFQITAQQWQQVSELPAIQMSALLAKGDTLYAAGPNKVYFSFDGGQSWDSTLALNLDFDFIQDLHYVKGKLYAGTGIDGVFWSDDGQNWHQNNTGLSGAGAHDISGLVSRGDSLYVSTYGAGVFVKKISSNSSWSTYNSNLPWFNVESISNVEGKLFAGAGGNATVSYQAYPAGSWSEVPFAEFDGSLNAFLGAIKTDDILIGAGTLGLYRSTDGGDTWTTFITGLGVMGLVRLTEFSGRVFANLVKPGGLTFILYTDDKGLSWESFPDQITGAVSYDLVAFNNQLYSARNDGLWYRALVTSTNNPPLAGPNLGQNFPNPFLEKTTIPLTLNMAGHVDVSIHNVYGQKTATLFSGHLKPGQHTFELDGRALPTGLYCYRVHTSSGIYSKLMVLAK